jgi:hypothetical protein
LKFKDFISIFPDDIRHIARGARLKWDEIAQPDRYSCLLDQDNFWAIGWIFLEIINTRWDSADLNRGLSVPNAQGWTRLPYYPIFFFFTDYQFLQPHVNSFLKS